MTRLEFLERSGWLAAGFTLLPHSLRGAGQKALETRTVSSSRLGSYEIVVPDNASPIESQAAEKLQHYLAQVSPNKLEIRKEGAYHGGGPAFFIGRTRYAEARHIDWKQLQEDGFALHPARGNLIVAGGTGKGVLYGIYALLELSGFRMYTSACIAVPKTGAVSLPKEPLVTVPVIEYRTTSYHDTDDPEYTAWHRLSSRDEWGMFVHTANALVPPEKYGNTHPEYFSLINGVRQPGTQLCLSNHEVYAVLTANLKERMAAKPNATYWSVSQNDNDQYCRCEPCTQLNAKYGGVPSGSILFFVNEVAKAFPDKTISTLAYWYSRPAPQNIQAERNVNIMLCNIESKRQKPVFETDTAFSQDLISWGRISNNILIWDYNIQFSNLVSPFPNLHTIKPNINFYTAHHVKSLFMQANSRAGGEFAGLRAYLISELMWNPDADDSAMMDDYLGGYFSNGGRYIRQYIDRMRESLLSSGFQLDIFGSPQKAKDAYLSAEMMKAYQALFDQAEAAVKNDPQLLTRVKVARLPIQYAELQIGRDEVDTPRSMFAHTPEGKVMVKPAMKALVAEFVTVCNQDRVARLEERSTTPDDYLASYDRVFTRVDETRDAKSFGKNILSTTLPKGGDAKAQQLTDGIFGSFESWRAPDVHWVTYTGEHMDFVLDLGALTDIWSIQMDFLNAQAQPDWNLMILPQYVTYATSVDGKDYGNEMRIDNPNNPNPKENPDITKIKVQPFRVDFATYVRAQYIKVHGENVLRMPHWHIRAGSPASIYSDQIVVT